MDTEIHTDPTSMTFRKRAALMVGFNDAAAQEVKYLGKYARVRVYGEGERPGWTLARLLRPSYQSNYITQLRTDEDQILTSPDDVANTLLQYYTRLYETRHPPEPQTLHDYLQGIAMVWIDNADREFIAAPIDAEEVKLAINALACGKAPGSDGLTADFYKAYQNLLAPQLIVAYAEALESGSLPPTMREAIVTLLLKPGKDPQRCQSYRPLSLLNHDYKILAKILAARFALLVDTILCPYQAGFIPGRSTTLNIRTIFFCN